MRERECRALGPAEGLAILQRQQGEGGAGGRRRKGSRGKRGGNGVIEDRKKVPVVMAARGS